MSINKEELFKDFLEKKQKQVEERQSKLENITPAKNKNNKKNKHNKNKQPVMEQQKLFDIEPVKKNNDPYQQEEFLVFKEEFMKNQIVKDFMTSLDMYRERGFNMFESNDFFIKAKMEHPDCRAIIVEPSIADISVGKGGSVYIVKPMYKKEYTTFQKVVGDRASHNEEFITFALLECILYPERITEPDIEKMGAGTIITLYNTISNLSDFNKNFTVVEV